MPRRRYLEIPIKAAPGRGIIRLGNEGVDYVAVHRGEKAIADTVHIIEETMAAVLRRTRQAAKVYSCPAPTADKPGLFDPKR